jgi:hypothetical protein
VIPIFREHLDHAPTKRPQHTRAQKITFQQIVLRVVRRIIDQDTERVTRVGSASHRER